MKKIIQAGLIVSTLASSVVASEAALSDSSNTIGGYEIIPLPYNQNDKESICGDSTDWLDVENYDGSLGPSINFVKNYEKSTVKLILPVKNSRGAYSCTGTLISNDTILTAGHCINSNVDRSKIFTLFNFQKDTNGNARKGERYNADKVLEVKKGNLDYAILTVKGIPSNKYPSVKLNNNLPTNSEQLTIIQHPNGIQKVIESGNYQRDKKPYITYIDLDTSKGSSGAGVLDSKGKLVAVHTNGGCTANGGANKGVALARIAEVSPTIKNLLSTTIKAPSNLKATNITKTSATLIWIDNSKNEKGFKVYNGKKLVATLGANTTHYSLERLKENTAYYYSVKAYNTKDLSIASTTKFITKGDGNGGKPSEMITPINHSVIPATTTFKWSKSASARLNYIYVQDVTSHKLLKYGYVKTTNITLSKLASGHKIRVLLYSYINHRYIRKAYSYTVKGINNELKAPSNLKATNITKTSATLVWNDNSKNEKGFKVYNGKKLVATLRANTTHYSLDKLKEDTLYYYSIKAYNDKGESAFNYAKFVTKGDNTDSNAIEMITPLNHSVISATTTFKWSKRASKKHNYINIYDTTGHKFIKYGSINTESITISNMIPGHKIRVVLYSYINHRYIRKVYYYTVKGINNGLNAPSNLKATNITKTSATLVWNDNSKNEKGFKVYNGKKLVATLGANTTHYSLEKLKKHTPYYYSVRAYNAKGESAICKTKFITKGDGGKPSEMIAPRNHSVIPTTATFKWSRSQVIKSNRISVVDLTERKVLKHEYTKRTNLTIRNLHPGHKIRMTLITIIDGSYYSKSYNYKVEGVDNSPSAPSKLKATNITKTSATLVWNDNSKNEKGFKVYNGKKLVATLGANTTHYSLERLKENTAYYYSVKAFNSDGESALSYTKFITKGDIGKPSIMVSPRNHSVIPTTTTFKWSKSTGNYIYVQDVTSHKALKYGSINTESITISNMIPGHKIRVVLYSYINHRYIRKVYYYTVNAK